ncbi:hypothetical protein PGTUg99_012659 [Puccinia graminis f. sp. tritici]|uniref:Uncharacterized protein n=1 Tax=Puccinia graminis f. sp. tritici TaxID=56615 RepID=A0A5B0RGB6_PUCGR|nr:hypothetical protein PGTUg99_012659 [Puccinia graminis f. sp. tritici]
MRFFVKPTLPLRDMLGIHTPVLETLRDIEGYRSKRRNSRAGRYLFTLAVAVRFHTEAPMDAGAGKLEAVPGRTHSMALGDREEANRPPSTASLAHQTSELRSKKT